MPGEDRIAYTDAVTCLQSKAPLYTDIAGSKSMFDDFVALHQNMTGYVHMSVSTHKLSPDILPADLPLQGHVPPLAPLLHPHL